MPRLKKSLRHLASIRGKNKSIARLCKEMAAGNSKDEDPVQKPKTGKTTLAKAFKIRLVPPPKSEAKRKSGRSKASAKKPAKKALVKKATPKQGGAGCRGRPRKIIGEKPAEGPTMKKVQEINWVPALEVAAEDAAEELAN